MFNYIKISFYSQKKVLFVLARSGDNKFLFSFTLYFHLDIILSRFAGLKSI